MILLLDLLAALFARSHHLFIALGILQTEPLKPRVVAAALSAPKAERSDVRTDRRDGRRIGQLFLKLGVIFFKLCVFGFALGKHVGQPGIRLCCRILFAGRQLLELGFLCLQLILQRPGVSHGNDIRPNQDRAKKRRGDDRQYEKAICVFHNICTSGTIGLADSNTLQHVCDTLSL